MTLLNGVAKQVRKNDTYTRHFSGRICESEAAHIGAKGIFLGYSLPDLRAV